MSAAGWMTRIRERVRRLVGRSGADYVERDGLRLPRPEARYCTAEFRDDAFYVASARAEVRRLRDVAGLCAASRVLDVGAGQGRLPIGLLADGAPFARYVGVDVDRRSVDWCRRNVAPGDPRFTFLFVDRHNARYNPRGRDAGAATLPVDPGSFDVVFLYSVLTHMRSDDVRAHLDEIRRVLAPQGRAFFTVYVEDDCADETENPPDYLSELGEPSGPLHRVRFRTAWFDGLLANAGLRVVRSWRHSEAVTRQSAYLVERQG